MFWRIVRRSRQKERYLTTVIGALRVLTHPASPSLTSRPPSLLQIPVAPLVRKQHDCLFVRVSLQLLAARQHINGQWLLDVTRPTCLCVCTILNASVNVPEVRVQKVISKSWQRTMFSRTGLLQTILYF